MSRVKAAQQLDDMDIEGISITITITALLSFLRSHPGLYPVYCRAKELGAEFPPAVEAGPT